MILPWNFSQPENMRRHNQQVADGEYAPVMSRNWVPTDWAPRVLDIGACCGAFAWWVTRAFPAAQVESFEPNPAAFEHLMKNARTHFPSTWRVTAQGVRAHAGAYHMLPGANNLGEAAMYDLGEQQLHLTAPVECIAAADLPDCDWLKVDTEGCEVEIIEAYLNRRTFDNLGVFNTSWHPSIVSFEFHRVADFGRLFTLLTQYGYVLNRANIHRPDRGTCVFVGEP